MGTSTNTDHAYSIYGYEAGAARLSIMKMPICLDCNETLLAPLVLCEPCCQKRKARDGDGWFLTLINDLKRRRPGGNWTNNRQQRASTRTIPPTGITEQNGKKSPHDDVQQPLELDQYPRLDNYSPIE